MKDEQNPSLELLLAPSQTCQILLHFSFVTTEEKRKIFCKSFLNLAGQSWQFATYIASHQNFTKILYKNKTEKKKQ